MCVFGNKKKKLLNYWIVSPLFYSVCKALVWIVMTGCYNRGRHFVFNVTPLSSGNSTIVALSALFYLRIRTCCAGRNTLYFTTLCLYVLSVSASVSCLPVYEDANCGCAETVECDCTLAVHPLHLKKINFEVKFWGQIKRRAASYEVKARKLMKPWCCSSFNDLTATIQRNNCSCESVLLDEMVERIMTEVRLSGAVVESVNMSLGQPRTVFAHASFLINWELFGNQELLEK